MFFRSARDFFPSKYRSTPEFVTATTPGQSRMKALTLMLEKYMKAREEYDVMMNERRWEYEEGKRLLAKMMCVDYHEMTEDEVNKAIEYFFPSGLTEPRARPFMKPPERYTPKFPIFEFDEIGRPKDPYFYTFNPSFYKLLSVSYI